MIQFQVGENWDTMFHFFDNCLQSLLAIADNFLGEKRCRASYLPLHEVFAVSVFLKLSCYILLTVYLMYCLPFKTIDSREQSVSITTYRSLVAQVFLELSVILLTLLFFNTVWHSTTSSITCVRDLRLWHRQSRNTKVWKEESTHLIKRLTYVCNNYLLGNAGSTNHWFKNHHPLLWHERKSLLHPNTIFLCIPREIR